MSVEARLALLENLREIEQLKYRYASCCDRGYDLEGLRAIFVPEGRWAANGYGEFHGQQAICDFFAALSRKVVTVLHYVSAPQVTIAADGLTATGSFYLHCLSRVRRDEASAEVDFFVQMGVYSDTFVKTAAGWRFGSIEVDVMHTERLDRA